MLFSGDFRQILPVIPGGSKTQVITGCLKNSKLYEKFEKLTLSQNMRLEALRNDPDASQDALDYPGYLLEVGEARVEDTINQYDIEVPTAVNRVTTLQDLIEFTYSGIQDNFRDQDWLSSRIILTMRNSRLADLNDGIGRRIAGDY